MRSLKKKKSSKIKRNLKKKMIVPDLFSLYLLIYLGANGGIFFYWQNYLNIVYNYDIIDYI